MDQLEAALPGVTALYLQGTCGDVNFRREYNGTERRFEPARALANAALAGLSRLRPVERPGRGALTRKLMLPTRRWTHEEVMRDRRGGVVSPANGRYDGAGWRAWHACA